MKKLILLLAIIGLTSIAYAQQKSSENKSEHLKQFFSQITPLLAGAPIVEVF